MSQVHTPRPPLVGRAHVDLCRRGVAACRRAFAARLVARMRQA